MDSCVTSRNIKHDWYQTDDRIIVNVLLKQVKPEDIKVDITEKQVTCSAKLTDSSDHCLVLNLSNEINPQQSSWKVLPSKIEIRLSKVEAIRWNTLLQLDDANISGSSTAKIYPSSRSQKKDWDKLANEINEEDDDNAVGDAALNKMFQKIYCEGSDETRKAMNKSFVESGGTVLSTNWKDIRDKKIEIKPPDGMEWKKWDS